MFAIGEFARHARVSVRMLRHYDAIGLLEPARVDPSTGYRCYEAGQLSRLNRIAAIESEASEPAPVMVKRISAVRVAELTGTAAGYEPQFITPVIQPLYHELPRQLCEARIAITGPGVAYYEDAAGDEGAVTVHAALPVAALPVAALPVAALPVAALPVAAPPVAPLVSAERPGGLQRFSVVDLAEIPTAATVIHHGSMDNVLPSIQALARWIDASGYHSLGYAREVTLKFSDDRDDWVTELQEPIAPKEAA
jgi:hypothetical protein